ncbi:carbonic anhydrase [Pyrenophora seminiperda CCB06]|uniref:Carbonic anhydrase n=1 Tax=Pyrenophora seminiperda CCB06 TaxID=1302712 RepID=A0A3M7MC60_9PLEO|nr:carbonic anhydrase [Pyrenophora seminiperda CCB06]
MLFKTLLLASTASATCMHGLSMAKRATDDTVKVGTFGYGPLNGAMNWASLSVANEACKTGKNQSPINIGTSPTVFHSSNPTPPNSSTLDASIKLATSRPILSIPEVASMDFLNLGTTIEVVVNGTTSFAGTDYRLVQFHMHTPSEHHISDEYYPLEIHMVHQGVADSSQLAVIALMFQVSATKSSSIISSLSSSLPKIATPGTKTPIAGGIDFSDVQAKLKSSDILQYAGSLTTPPCAEGVTFLIVKDPLDISVADFNAIKKIVKFNSRFIQNTLGAPNMMDVGAMAGTPNAYMPVNATVQNKAPAVSSVSPTSTASATSLLVTEIKGKPTYIPSIVVDRRKPKY